jgi:hypothetical protein
MPIAFFVFDVILWLGFGVAGFVLLDALHHAQFFK